VPHRQNSIIGPSEESRKIHSAKIHTQLAIEQRLRQLNLPFSRVDFSNVIYASGLNCASREKDSAIACHASVYASVCASFPYFLDARRSSIRYAMFGIYVPPFSRN
jgi:hypothetical protein